MLSIKHQRNCTNSALVMSVVTADYNSDDGGGVERTPLTRAHSGGITVDIRPAPTSATVRHNTPCMHR